MATGPTETLEPRAVVLIPNQAAVVMTALNTVMATDELLDSFTILFNLTWDNGYTSTEMRAEITSIFDAIVAAESED